MPSMKMKTTSGALVVAALGVLGVAGPVGAQVPAGVAVAEATARARAALEMARSSTEQAAERAEATQAALEMTGATTAALETALPRAQAALYALGAHVAVGIPGSSSYQQAPDFRTAPPAAWLQQDPAGKAYQAAREAITDGRYAEAAKSFAALRSKYPKSGYVPDSYYWQAFALYRAGARSDLQKALELLGEQSKQYPQAETAGDARGLRVRVESQLAGMGDAAAAEAVAQQAKDPCQSDDQSVRVAALSALMNMKTEQALPILKEVLKSRDACSAALRRQAVFLVAQKRSPESVDILLDVAQRNPDPDPKVREAAVLWLSQAHTDQAVNALEAILKESKDPKLQERAVFALSQQGSPRAIAMLRDYAGRADAPADLRESAIFWIGQNPKAGGTGYLMQLYPKLQNDTLKEKAIFSIGQARTAESHDWLLARAKDRSESLDVRKNALFWAGQSGSLTGADLKGLYGTLTDPAMKKQVIFVASQSKDKAAVDFLMDVAKNEKDAALRKSAVFWLGQSKDPRVAEFLLNLIKR